MRILVISFMVLTLTLVTSADKLYPDDYPPPPPVPLAPGRSAKTTGGSVKTTTTTISTTTTTSRSTTTVKTTLKPITTQKKKVLLQKTKEPTLVKTLPQKPKSKRLSKLPQRKKKLPPKIKNLKKKPLVQRKKRPLKQVKKQQQQHQQPQAERRDSSYGAPAPPKRQVIIKQAGPSKQYAWIGHGRYAPLNIRNPFPADLPKWFPHENNIFEAGLLYPGKPGGKPAPPPPSYSAAAPAPPAPPAPPSYSAPAATYSAEPIIPNYESAESVDSYSAPIKPIYAPPQPVYNPQPTSAPIPVPADIPAQPAYQSGSVPSYGSSSLIAAAPEPPVTAVPAYTTAPPPPAYYKPATTTTARPTYQQPPISSKPFTVFGSQAQSTYTQQPAYIIPKIEVVYEPIGKPGNFPKFNSLPGFDGQTYLEPKPPAYKAAASYASPKKTVAPSTQNSYNAYDVALKVEETYATPEEEEDQDVYFIFYEDNQETKEPPPPPAPTPLQGYISEAASVPSDSNQFKPPSDIRTIYVPYENAVNVPDIFDVSVGAGFGYIDQPPVTKSPAAVQSSYDNPISSFDAPIYDENSYTAEASSYDANTFAGTLWRDNTGSLQQIRKARKPAGNGLGSRNKGATHFGYQPTSIKFDPQISNSNVPFGSRLSSRTPYEILGL